MSRDRRPDPPALAVEVWGRALCQSDRPCRGFDKNAEVADAMLDLGFGFVGRSAASRPGRRRETRGRGCSASPKTAASSIAWAFPARDSMPPAPGSPSARVAARWRQCGRQQGQHRSRRRLRGLQRGACTLLRLSRLQRFLAQQPGLRTLQGRSQLAGLLKRVQGAINHQAGAAYW